jgi:hypothetical protein
VIQRAASFDTVAQDGDGLRKQGFPGGTGSGIGGGCGRSGHATPNLIFRSGNVERLRLGRLLLGYLAGYGLQLAFLPFGKQPPFSRRSLDFYLKNNAYNITKARQQLGFQPQIDLPTGLRETLQQPEKLFAWQIS